MCNIVLLFVFILAFVQGYYSTNPLNNRAICENKAYPPDIKNGCCGIDGSFGNKIVGGSNTAIDQYPWAALIEYVPLNTTLIKQNLLLCGGSLISSKYVLTAAHCFFMSEGLVKPEYVRLGEYNTTNNGKDCVEVEGGGIDCTDPVVIIEIKRYIHHPQYMFYESKNDIALIQLKKSAPYTDFIRPICLPTHDIFKSPPARLKLRAVGWGVINDKYDISEIKQHIILPFVRVKECQRRYIGSKHSPITDDQICAGGEKNRDTCTLDSGGPLMFESEASYVLVGITSFGPVPCGLEDTPGVYVNVYNYLPWILNITGS
ncbi:phenoloxidase-activating enzyme-like [Achroia grisella]|uniref:phenoloxidase-activating enzyme-like n=1 Tax=Achroia grisella TaxID=688607 RepID=UPI0027D200C3|nr:phenoloxidase-activating enzyme-like [Achroia grisella]